MLSWILSPLTLTRLPTTYKDLAIMINFSIQTKLQFNPLICAILKSVQKKKYSCKNANFNVSSNNFAVLRAYRRNGVGY